MKTIAFFTPQLDVRGTCDAVYWYAHYNEEILHNRSIIIARVDYQPKSDQIVIDKFTSRFSSVSWVNNPEEMNSILQQEGVDILYNIKYGKRDEWIGRGVKNVVHCVFDLSEPHGDVYAAVSKTLAKKYNSTLYVPHMIGLQKGDPDDNLRSELKIPNNAIVFGRHGGDDTFNIPFCYDVIKRVLYERPDIYFVFVNTPKFYLHPRAVFLHKITGNSAKNRYINTLDAYLECNTLGHSAGIALGEASVNNKPLIVYNGKLWNTSHIDMIGNKGIYFKTATEFYDILNNFNPRDYDNVDLNCYKEWNAESVMKKFSEVFIE